MILEFLNAVTRSLMEVEDGAATFVENKDSPGFLSSTVSVSQDAQAPRFALLAFLRNLHHFEPC